MEVIRKHGHSKTQPFSFASGLGKFFADFPKYHTMFDSGLGKFETWPFSFDSGLGNS